MKVNKKTVIFSTVINIGYAVANLFIGISDASYWFLMTAAYYTLLSLMRLLAVSTEKPKWETIITRAIGVMLVLSVFPLLGTVIISSFQKVGTKFHEIVMISIALYSFIKVSLAIVNIARARRFDSCTLKTLRSVSFADALVSILSLQRSMLISFGEMLEADVRIFNIVTGIAVCIFVFLIGIQLVVIKQKNRPTT